MKRSVFFITVFFLLSIWSAQASIMIANAGTYENSDIKFMVFYNWGNSTPMPNRPVSHFSNVRFEIIAKKGQSIFNRSYFVFEGRDYVFQSQQVDNYFYTGGYRVFDDKRLKDGDVIGLVYELRKKGSYKYIETKKYSKKFKVVLPKKPTRPRNEITLIEIK